MQHNLIRKLSKLHQQEESNAHQQEKDNQQVRSKKHNMIIKKTHQKANHKSTKDNPKKIGNEIPPFSIDFLLRF